MTKHEGYKIFAESFIQTENTKGAYFLRMSKELAIDPISFLTDLKKLYEGLVKEVNTIWPNHYGADDDNGNKEPVYKTINFSQYTNGGYWVLDKFNIEQFLPGLEQFGQILKEQEQTTSTPKHKPTGFQSSLKDYQIENLYSQMNGNYFEATPDNFKAIFKSEPLPPDCSIKWKKTNVLLSYFIKKLFHSDNPFNVWIKAESIFEIKNLRQSENTPYPGGHKDIDTILKTIYTPLQ